MLQLATNDRGRNEGNTYHQFVLHRHWFNIQFNQDNKELTEPPHHPTIIAIVNCWAQYSTISVFASLPRLITNAP